MNTLSSRPLRVVMTKAGLDAHERGVHVVSRGLRDHGMEVIVLGLRQPPDTVARVAIQEDADVIGVSSLAGGHLAYIAALIEKMRELESDSIVVVGGVIPADDVPKLHDLGVAAIFPPGTLVSEIAAKLTELGQTRIPD